MSLIEEMFEPCVLIEKHRVPDGEGGFDVEWAEVAEFECAIGRNSSMQARIGESQGTTAVYTITTHRNVKLDYHDIVKRKNTGKILRVTSDAGDIVSPAFSDIDMAQVSAEKWELTDDKRSED